VRVLKPLDESLFGIRRRTVGPETYRGISLCASGKPSGLSDYGFLTTPKNAEMCAESYSQIVGGEQENLSLELSHSLSFEDN